MNRTSIDLIAVDYPAPFSTSLALEIPTVDPEEKVVEPTTEKKGITTTSMLLYQQASIRVEREDDDEPPQFYSVRWWIRCQSSELHRPIDWCHNRKLAIPNYD
ncbi:MAG: hypothetical protein H3Z50_00510 [archaeon]|nr:hypothetical protein [archaeon]MCP8305693.1 hypothetical protein [archaeon]